MRRSWLALGICGVSIMVGASVCKHFEWHVPLPHRATKPLDHVPTPKTIARWKAWDAKRTLREYDLACGPVATKDISLDLTLTEMDLPTWTDAEIVPVKYGSGGDGTDDRFEHGSDEGVEEPATVTTYAANSYPLPWPYVPYGYAPPGWIVLPPKHPGKPVSPPPPPIVPEVPEPASIWLLLTGIIGMIVIVKKAIPSYPQAVK